MNGLDFLSVYVLITLFSSWIDGLPNTLPPAKCHWFYLNATAPYRKANKKPTAENLQKVIQILTSPYDLTEHPTSHCYNTTVTLQNSVFSSSPELKKTKLNLTYKVDPHKNIPKQYAYDCAENMLYQGSVKTTEVLRLLKLREGSYKIDQKACCEEQHEYYKPCCRKGYKLKNLTCFKDEIDTETRPVNKKGEVVKMESEDKCESSGPTLSVGIIIIIVSGGIILFVSFVLVGVRVWKYRHRPNTSGYNHQETLTQPEKQPDDRRNTGESTCPNVAKKEKEGTINGYMKMKDLRGTNPLEQKSTTPPFGTVSDHSDETPLMLRDRRHTRPKSRAESMFNFDKHICIEDIHFTNKMLGRGQFGQVELAYVKIHEVERQCAVKMIRGRGTNEDERELFEELQMLYQIPDHPNVVSLLGGCMEEDKPLYVVVEYCSKGSLLKYLHKNRGSSHEYVNVSGPRLDFRWKLLRAMEICTGMIFLAQRQIIHRDLAARNILLDENEVAKISDFGMAKDVYLRGLYIKETSGFLPVRWMAIEAIESSIYTIKSDMWSFGILLWELYMDGLNPYPGITDGSELLEKYLKKGYRMAQPEHCPEAFYQLMERCWLTKPDDRPSFTQALRDLQVIKDDENRRQSEASKITEISDAGDNDVFENDPPLCDETALPKKTQLLEKDDQELQNRAVNIDIDSPIEIGIVNRARSSIDSGTNVELPFSGGRKNSIAHSSRC